MILNGKELPPRQDASFAQSAMSDRGRFLSQIPRTHDAAMLALMDAVRTRGELYDDSTLTPAFEARNVNRPGIHATKKGLMSRFTINRDFPWRVPAGTDESENASRWFARVPPEDG